MQANRFAEEALGAGLALCQLALLKCLRLLQGRVAGLVLGFRQRGCAELFVLDRLGQHAGITDVIHLDHLARRVLERRPAGLGHAVGLQCLHDILQRKLGRVNAVQGVERLALFLGPLLRRLGALDSFDRLDCFRFGLRLRRIAYFGCDGFLLLAHRDIFLLGWRRRTVASNGAL